MQRNTFTSIIKNGRKKKYDTTMTLLRGGHPPKVSKGCNREQRTKRPSETQRFTFTANRQEAQDTHSPDSPQSWAL